MSSAVRDRHDVPMTPSPASTWWLWTPPVVFVLGVSASAVAVLGPASVPSPADLALTTALLLPALLTGCVVALRVPASPVGGARVWVGAAPAAVFAVEHRGETAASAQPWPLAGLVTGLQESAWPWLFVGFVALVLVFPDGLLPDRRWRVIAVPAPVAALLLTAAITLDESNFAAEGGPLPGPPPFDLPALVRVAELVLVFGLFLGVLLAAAASLVVRFRRGDELTRLRVRWLMLDASSVPVLLAVSWLALALGVPGDFAFAGFLVAMLVLVPAAVGVAILRHDLFDVDRLLGEGLRLGAHHAGLGGDLRRGGRCPRRGVRPRLRDRGDGGGVRHGALPVAAAPDPDRRCRALRRSGPARGAQQGAAVRLVGARRVGRARGGRGAAAGGPRRPRPAAAAAQGRNARSRISSTCAARPGHRRSRCVPQTRRCVPTAPDAPQARFEARDSGSDYAIPPPSASVTISSSYRLAAWEQSWRPRAVRAVPPAVPGSFPACWEFRCCRPGSHFVNADRCEPHLRQGESS